MNTKWLKTVILIFTTIILTQCSQNDYPDSSEDWVNHVTDEVNKGETLAAPASPIQATFSPTEVLVLPTSILSTQEPKKIETQMPQPTFSSSIPGIESLIEKAKEDLAQQLSISTSQINLLEAQAVVWPDSSLGCPQPGMMYSQVLTPGYLILLGANNKDYEYHAGKGSDVIYCENPSPPVPDMPGDT